MSTLELIFWLLLMLLGFAGSALYSGLETGAYSLNPVRLQILHHQHHRPAQTLRRLMDKPTQLLTTLLIGNNIVNYMGTASLAVILEAQRLSDTQVIVLNTLIITPMLFVFGETLPKDLFAVYSDRLMYRLVPVLSVSRALFTWTGLVPIVTGFSRLVMKLLGQPDAMPPFHPRRRVQALVREGVGYGLLSDDQSAMVGRVLRLGERRVSDEMTPWDQVVAVRDTAAAPELWDLANRSSHTRFPVIDEVGRVVGMLNMMAVLAHEPQHCPPVREIMQPPVMMDAALPLRQGMTLLQQQHTAFAVVVDKHGQPTGLVTIKDLVEAITGELANW